MFFLINILQVYKTSYNFFVFAEGDGNASYCCIFHNLFFWRDHNRFCYVLLLLFWSVQTTSNVIDVFHKNRSIVMLVIWAFTKTKNIFVSFNSCCDFFLLLLANASRNAREYKNIEKTREVWWNVLVLNNNETQNIETEWKQFLFFSHKYFLLFFLFFNKKI
jgi:hypothetical protein